MAYHFEVTIIKPEEERDTFSGQRLSKQDLSNVTSYLQQKTSRGIPIKFRVGIFYEETKRKIMSVILDTKNTSETDIKQLLMDRITDQELLIYLNDTDLSKSQNQKKQVLVEQKEVKNNLPQQERETIATKPLPKSTTSKPIKSEQNKGSINQKTKIFLLIFAILTVLLILVTVIQQVQINSIKTTNEDLETQLKEVENTDLSQSKIDTFGRFFLTNYFSTEEDPGAYQSSLKTYISDMDISDWQTLSTPLKSVNYYGSVNKGKLFEATYVITNTQGDRSVMQKITFEVEPTEDSFVVVNKPTIEEFSFN